MRRFLRWMFSSSDREVVAKVETIQRHQREIAEDVRDIKRRLDPLRKMIEDMHHQEQRNGLR